MEKVLQKHLTGRIQRSILPLPNTGKSAIVVELKYGKSAATAIQQIKDRHYTQALEGYTDEILLVGVNYDKAL